MKTLNEILSDARNGNYAIGHFNFATVDVLRAIVEGSKEAGASAVMVGTSQGEADFLGMREAVALVHIIRTEHNFPVYLNADHFKSFEKCHEAIERGYDSVAIDASKLPYNENIELTKRVVKYAHRPGRNITVEGELGYLRGSSQIQKSIEITLEDYTKPKEVSDFVEKTEVDRLAVVFGNIHGVVTKQRERLDIAHLERIVEKSSNAHLVLHGASGLLDKEILSAIKAGIVNVHFNTELRVAYAKAIEESFHKSEKQETTPYKYLSPAAEEVKKLVIHKTKLFMQ